EPVRAHAGLRLPVRAGWAVRPRSRGTGSARRGPARPGPARPARRRGHAPPASPAPPRLGALHRRERECIARRDGALPSDGLRRLRHQALRPARAAGHGRAPCPAPRAAEPRGAAWEAARSGRVMHGPALGCCNAVRSGFPAYDTAFAKRNAVMHAECHGSFPAPKPESSQFLFGPARGHRPAGRHAGPSRLGNLTMIKHLKTGTAAILMTVVMSA